MAGDMVLGIILRAKDEASQVLGKVNQSIGGSSKHLQDFGKRAQDVGGKLSLGLTAPLMLMGGAAIDAASDLSESTSKMNTVFGESASKVEEWANGSAKSIGLAKQQALEASGTLGNLFTAMGSTKSEAADLSVNVVNLAADLGSFNNLGTPEVLEKLRAGLTGEAEPLKSLGIAMNADMVQAKAMEMGLADANGELSEGALIQARYAIIMDQTKTAQGDFSRTSTGLANSSRIAKAQMADLSAELGEELLPFALEATKAASGLLGAFQGLSPEMKTAAVAGGAFLAALGPVSGTVGTVATVLGSETAAQIGSTAAKVAGQAASGTMTAAQWALNAAMSANPIMIVVIALAALAAGLIYAYQNSEDFRRIVDAIFATLGSLVQAGIQIATDAINGAGQLITNLGTMWQQGWDALKGIVDGGVKGVQDLINGLLTFFSDVVSGKFLSQAQAWGGNLISGLVTGLATLGADLMKAIGDAINSIKIDIGPFHLDSTGFRIDAPTMPSISLPEIPGRAGGGGINANEPYFVGERGIEMIVPGRSGTVIPANQLMAALGGGGGQVTLGPVYVQNREDAHVLAYRYAQITARMRRERGG